MDFTCKALNYPISQAQFYTDSTIVLSWIGSHASRWKTFVANRVAKIQTLSSGTQWHNISGSANPADLATRGVSSSTLLTSIWLCGPKFLHETFPFQTDSSVPTLNDAVPEESERKVVRDDEIKKDACGQLLSFATACLCCFWTAIGRRCLPTFDATVLEAEFAIRCHYLPSLAIDAGLSVSLCLPDVLTSLLGDASLQAPRSPLPPALQETRFPPTLHFRPTDSSPTLLFWLPDPRFRLLFRPR
ncbi:integrase catalytic domain-containing protein [Trichonephila clavata]|uniref:Integrase catalytic domain-containing protein n=1 Tax=Trichonephila clavata TaxID=2740835 RepID=A0A8X6GXE6_TRICU|nr:integrase catalytic domain-containing protein [Trichonephila clavata]